MYRQLCPISEMYCYSAHTCLFQAQGSVGPVFRAVLKNLSGNFDLPNSKTNFRWYNLFAVFEFCRAQFKKPVV